MRAFCFLDDGGLVRRMTGLFFCFFFGFLGAGGRLPKARRGRIYCSIHHNQSWHTSGRRLLVSP